MPEERDLSEMIAVLPELFHIGDDTHDLMVQTYSGNTRTQH